MYLSNLPGEHEIMEQHVRCDVVESPSLRGVSESGLETTELLFDFCGLIVLFVVSSVTDLIPYILDAAQVLYKQHEQ